MKLGSLTWAVLLTGLSAGVYWAFLFVQEMPEDLREILDAAVLIFLSILWVSAHVAWLFHTPRLFIRVIRQGFKVTIAANALTWAAVLFGIATGVAQWIYWSGPAGLISVNGSNSTTIRSELWGAIGAITFLSFLACSAKALAEYRSRAIWVLLPVPIAFWVPTLLFLIYVVAWEFFAHKVSQEWA